MGTTADKLQAILNSKAAIKTAINNKGGSITDSTPLDEYATAIGNIPTPILQSKIQNPSTSQQIITPDVGYNGLSQVAIKAVTSSIDGNIQAGNIKKDVTILGVTGTFEGGGETNFENLVARTITSVDNNNITTIGAYAFDECRSLISVSLPNCTTTNNSSFQNCRGLTSVNLPSLTKVNNYDFYFCNSLQNLSLPSLTGDQGNYCFEYCSSLVTIDLGNASKLGADFFRYCTSLQSITLRKTGSICTLTSDLAIPQNYGQTITVYVPSNLITSYQNATNWYTLYFNNYVTFVAIPE